MDVPTLTPMMMGTDARTVSTVGVPCQPPSPYPATTIPRGEGALTLGGHHADHDGGGRAGALHEDSDQHAEDQPSHGVGQHHVVLEGVPGYFACARERRVLRWGTAGGPACPWPPGPSLTAQQLEGRAEDVQGADEEVEAAQEPAGLEDADHHLQRPAGHAEL